MEKLHLNKQGTKVIKPEPKLHTPDYTLDGVASEPKFYKNGEEVEPPKQYHPKWKFWKS